MNTQTMIKEGKIIPVDFDYLTDDGRMIRRKYVGRRGTTLKWQVEGVDFLYRSLYEAYYDLQY